MGPMSSNRSREVEGYRGCSVVLDLFRSSRVARRIFCLVYAPQRSYSISVAFFALLN